MALISANCWAGRRKLDLGISKTLRSGRESALSWSTATSYYVPERKVFAQGDEADMGPHYSTRDFFRQVTNRLLGRYGQRREELCMIIPNAEYLKTL